MHFVFQKGTACTLSDASNMKVLWSHQLTDYCFLRDHKELHVVKVTEAGLSVVRIMNLCAPIFLSLCKLSLLISRSCDFNFCKILKKESLSVDAGELIGLGIRRDEILVILGTALISIYNNTLVQGCTTHT